MEAGKLHLVRLSVLDGRNIYEMLNRIGSDEHRFSNPVHGMSYEDYKRWLMLQDSWSKGERLPSGYVPQSVFWLFDQGTPIGMGKIRHSLTDESRIWGGNIGYALDPLVRGKGYGVELLRLLLEKADEMGVSEVLLSIEEDNGPSCRVAESNGCFLAARKDGVCYYSR